MTTHELLLSPDRLDRFAAREIDPEDDSEPTDPYLELRSRLPEIQKLVARLPDLEADTFDLHFLKGLPQAQIAEILGCGQPTVSYARQRALWRIRFLLEWAGKDIAPEQLLSDLAGVVLRPDILASYLRTSSYAATSRELGHPTPAVVRRRVMAAVRSLAGTQWDRYSRALEGLTMNANVLHSVSTPTGRKRQAKLERSID